MNTRTLLVVSARVDTAGRAAIAAGRSPRKDYFELKDALNADVIDYESTQSRALWRLMRRTLGIPVTQAVVAFSRHRRYDRIVTDGEHIGIPLALLLRLCPRRVRHITIGHLLTTNSKRRVFRWLRPQQRIDAIALHATVQQQIATTELGIAEESAPLIPYGVDARFWRSTTEPESDPTICAVGLEYRDYQTLIEAVRGLPVRLVIAAGSHWSRHRDQSGDAELPAIVSVTSLDYEALRSLYVRARFVVVPLREVANQAGITTILEAMAMERAVIVTATLGQRDAVRGRMVTATGIGTKLEGGPSGFGVTGAVAEEETGLYVPPADAAALRRAIVHLIEHPEEAARMGRAGRRLVEAAMNLDHFVERLAALTRGRSRSAVASNTHGPAAPLRAALRRE